MGDPGTFLALEYARSKPGKTLMRRVNPIRLLPLLLFALPCTALAAELRIAVAANFHGTLQNLAEVYEAHSGHTLRLSSGASGALYAQIVNGAPFDLFLSADRERPARLERDGHTVTGSRATYAIGIPVLWSARQDRVDPAGEVLQTGDFRHLAIAEPRNAPYGAAAQQVLEALGVWTQLQRERRLIRAQSIGQAYSQVASGAAPLGFVALAQLKSEGGAPAGSYWIPPATLHDPIEQQAVILRRAERDPQTLAAAHAFIDWLHGDTARRLIEAAGYRLPEGERPADAES